MNKTKSIYMTPNVNKNNMTKTAITIAFCPPDKELLFSLNISIYLEKLIQFQKPSVKMEKKASKNAFSNSLIISTTLPILITFFPFLQI